MEQISFDTKIRIENEANQVLEIPFERFGEKRSVEERDFDSEDVFVDKGDEIVVISHDATDNIMCTHFLDRAESLFRLQLNEFIGDFIPGDGANILFRDGQIEGEELAHFEPSSNFEKVGEKGSSPIEEKDDFEAENHGVLCGPCEEKVVFYD